LSASSSIFMFNNKHEHGRPCQNQTAQALWWQGGRGFLVGTPA
jgi:hypothetical protein